MRALEVETPCFCRFSRQTRQIHCGWKRTQGESLIRTRLRGGHRGSTRLKPRAFISRHLILLPSPPAGEGPGVRGRASRGIPRDPRTQFSFRVSCGLNLVAFGLGPEMILHVDMDAFYASVEERDRPELVGRPLIVGGTPQGRGVVAAANYAIRKFGVHSAMPTSKALKLCPQAIVIPPRLDYYAQISEQIREIFYRFTPLIEPLSLDEAFLDVTGSESLFGPSVEIGRRIKREIRESVHLVASVGVAPNKFLAKIASDLEKPDGFVVVDPAGVQAFLDPLPAGRLWGVGRVTGQALEQLGVQTINDVRKMPLEVLQQ